MLIAPGPEGQTPCRWTGSQTCPSRASLASGSARKLSGTPGGHARGPPRARWPRPPCHTQSGGARGLLPGRGEAGPVPLTVICSEHFKAPGEAKSPSGPRHEADAVTPRSRGKAGARGGKGARPGPRPGALRSTPLSVRPPQSRLWPTHRPSAQQGSTSGLGPLGPARPGSLSPAGSGPAEHTAPGRAVGPPASPPSSEDTLLRGPGQRRPFAHSPLAGLPGPRTGHVPQSHIHLPGDTYPIQGLSVPERSRGTATPPGVTLLPRELAAGACA